MDGAWLPSVGNGNGNFASPTTTPSKSQVDESQKTQPRSCSVIGKLATAGANMADASVNVSSPNRSRNKDKVGAVADGQSGIRPNQVAAPPFRLEAPVRQQNRDGKSLFNVDFIYLCLIDY